jgi:hypothetical protein
LSYCFRITAISASQTLAGPAFLIEPDSFIEQLGRDTALSDRNPCTTQMICHGRPMQVPTLGELHHVVTGLILGNQLLDFLWSKAALYLPPPGGLRSHPPA